ncbi:hypothetical protein NQ317_012542 [Molorchus minor]|uniref:Uncharacterized protein n=1 Tax=Molorchus minor TaxID=1323400 RepID=A0ABQ9K3Z7_9CUCU|nr:hypothetical protein NQ317_012542 [Molorchus minor]
MNRQKKVNYKKTESQIQSKADTKEKTLESISNKTLGKSEKSSVTATSITEKLDRPGVDANLDSPELYSTLKLSKQIDHVVKPRKTKSCSDVDKRKLAVDDKVLRKVNFPYDQPIYKDLIPLTCDRVHSQPVISSRGPLPQKDKEPVLSDFLEKKEMPQYYCLPSIKIENKLTIIGSNNLRLYKLLQRDNEAEL